MKYGMPTLLECRDVFECCDAALKYNLDFVEINTSFPDYKPSAISVDRLRKKAEECSLFFTIHADESLNPLDLDDRVSACYSEIMRETIEFAKAISAKVINMHLLRGIYVTLPDGVVELNDVYSEKYLEKIRQFIRICEKTIGDSGVIISIENVDSNSFTPAQKRAIELLLKSPVFALTLDTGHELMLGYRDTEVFLRYPDRIHHLHLHDSDGKSAHLPLGKGMVKISEKLSSLSSGDTVLIEVKNLDGLRESIEYLKKENLWKTGE